MDELISRREAIKVVRDSCHWDYPWASKSPNDIMSDAVNALKGLPSAQPERKTGRWINFTNSDYMCSVCGRMLVGITEGKNMVTKSYPYCHCGAKMGE